MMEELIALKSPLPATILSLLLMITQCNWVSYHWLRLSAKLVCLLKKWTIKRSTTLWCKSMHNWCFSPRNQDLRSRKGADFVRSVNPTPIKGQIMPTTKVTPPPVFSNLPEDIIRPRSSSWVGVFACFPKKKLYF